MLKLKENQLKSLIKSVIKEVYPGSSIGGDKKVVFRKELKNNGGAYIVLLGTVGKEYFNKEQFEGIVTCTAGKQKGNTSGSYIFNKMFDSEQEAIKTLKDFAGSLSLIDIDPPHAEN